MMFVEELMNIQLLWKEGDVTIDIEPGSTISQVLRKASILASTVIVCYGEQILPHSTVLNQDIMLEVLTISSGG
jgi:sulfur carrier protein ThiS